MKLFLKTLFWDVAIYLVCWVTHVCLKNIKMQDNPAETSWTGEVSWWPIEPLLFVIYLMVAFNLVIFSESWFTKKSYDKR